MNQEPLTKILERLKITDWDIVIVGDGSGSGWTDCCGWASVLIERLTQGRRTFYGGMNVGSINLAELMPYLHAITWFDAKFGKDRFQRKPTLSVHILTDSEVTVNNGQKMMRGQIPKAQSALWMAMQQFFRQGYMFHFHWIPRESCGLNWLADSLAGNTRRAVKDITLVDDSGEALNAHEFNKG